MNAPRRCRRCSRPRLVVVARPRRCGLLGAGVAWRRRSWCERAHRRADRPRPLVAADVARASPGRVLTAARRHRPRVRPRRVRRRVACATAASDGCSPIAPMARAARRGRAGGAADVRPERTALASPVRRRSAAPTRRLSRRWSTIAPGSALVIVVRLEGVSLPRPHHAGGAAHANRRSWKRPRARSGPRRARRSGGSPGRCCGAARRRRCWRRSSSSSASTRCRPCSRRAIPRRCRC